LALAGRYSYYVKDGLSEEIEKILVQIKFMHLLPLTILICLTALLGCSHTPKPDPYKLLINESGFVYVGMPKEGLAKAGYTKLLQKGYRKEDNQEWITFSNLGTKEPGDLVTFYIVDGKVRGWEEQFR
jgi:hypothetical protein